MASRGLSPSTYSVYNSLWDKSSEIHAQDQVDTSNIWFGGVWEESAGSEVENPSKKENGLIEGYGAQREWV